MDNCTRYHKEIYFPTTWGVTVERFIQGITNLFESKHYGQREGERQVIKVNKEDLKAADAFELAVNERGGLQRVGFRIKHLDESKDVVVIIACDGYVVTTWCNRKADNHRTLNKSLYATK